MPRLFVFGIGGTGSRILKSLTMLLASGKRAGNYDIIPVLIDPHKDLKELNECKKLLKLYGNIHDEIYKDIPETENDGFFRSKMVTLTSVAPGAGMKDEYDFDERHDIPFAQFLELEDMPDTNPTNDLLKLIYSKDNFQKPLSVGFKGNPNVGSVVLNSLKDSAGYRAFENVFGRDDKVFIVSSIFGGTGAAGFPLLLKNLRNSAKTVINESQIGALTVMPYFKLTNPDTSKDGPSSDIDSNNFLTKTKAALTYYTRPEFSNLYNALYYIADFDSQNKAYENNEKEQPNKAHLVEVLGALAVLHFANHNFQTRGEVFEYGLKEDVPSVDFTNIADETKRFIAEDLSSFYFFRKLHKAVKQHRNLPFRKTSKFDTSFFNQEVFRKVDEFLDAYYFPWLAELDDNERALSPFNLKENRKSFHGNVKGYEKEKKSFEGIGPRPFDVTDLFARMAHAEKKFSKTKEANKNHQYMAMCRLATKDMIQSNYQF